MESTPLSSDCESKNEEKKIENIQMKKTIGIGRGISIIVGGIIGSGIFASPKKVLVNSGSVGMALTVWFLCGCLSLGGALCMLELGLMIPKSGASYAYLKEAFGPIPAFLYLYTTLFIRNPAGIAIITITCGDYLVTAILGNDCILEDKALMVKLIAATCIGIVLSLNLASARWATSMHIVFTVLKMLAITIVILTGVVRLAQGYGDNFEDPFGGSTTRISGIGYAFYGGLWAYNGWASLNFVTEEVINPNKVMPKAIIGGLSIVTASYMLMNVAYLTVLTPAEVGSTNAVAVLLANRLFGVMAWIIPLLVSCSTFGTSIGTTFVSGRLGFAAARDGHLPNIFAMVHTKRNTPMPSLILPCIIAWLMLLPNSSNFSTLVNYFGFATWTFHGATFVALLWLRYKKPDMKRPFKVFLGIPIVTILGTAYVVVAPFYDYPLESSYALFFVLLGIPIYFIFIKYKLLPEYLVNKIDWMTYKLQILGDFAMTSKGEEDIL